MISQHKSLEASKALSLNGSKSGANAEFMSSAARLNMKPVQTQERVDRFEMFKKRAQ